MIAGRNTDIDALINAGAGGTPQELFHMAAVNELRVYVAVPEADSQAVQTGAKSTLTLDEFTGETVHGKIVRAPDSIDYVQPAAMRAKRDPGGRMQRRISHSTWQSPLAHIKRLECP